MTRNQMYNAMPWKESWLSKEWGEKAGSVWTTNAGSSLNSIF